MISNCQSFLKGMESIRDHLNINHVLKGMASVRDHL